MVHIGSLTIAEFGILLDKVPWFEEFANLFWVWNKGKKHDDQRLLLQQVDLVKFFPNGEWNDQFLPFIYYACNLGTLDALSYLPIHTCCRKSQPLTDSLQMLHMLGEEGHLLSRFSKKKFTIVYELNGREECIDDMIEMLMTPAMRSHIPEFTGMLKVFYRTVWPRKCINFWFITPLCKEAKGGSTQHFNAEKLPVGCPRVPNDVIAFNCKRCNVSGIIYDFWQYR